MIGNKVKTRINHFLPKQRNGKEDIFPALGNLSLFIEERHFPHSSQVTILVGCVLAISFFLWASIPLIENRIHLNGHIVYSNRIKSIQHIEGGIINETKVRDGEYVEKGQVLLILEGKGIQAELEQALSTEASFRIRAERLRAFALEQSPNFDAFIPKYQELVSDQLLIYEMQIKNWEAQKNSIEKQQERQKALLAIQLSQEKALRERLAVRNASKIRHELDQLLTQIHKARHSITEYDLKLDTLKVQLRNNAIREMDKITMDIAQVKESVADFQNRIKYLEIKAPVSGVVKGLNNSLLEGAVLPDGEIMKICPEDAWEVETRVSPQEIGKIKIGQPATLKIPTGDELRYGQIVGEVKSFSKLLFLDNDKKPYFKAYIAFKLPHFTNSQHIHKIAAGMKLQAHVHTGKKSLIQYLINPLYNEKS